jgi:predicted HicB family RNase H-like nuclease
MSEQDVKFRKPSEIAKKPEKIPVSCRLNVADQEILAKAAEKNGLSLGELISSVLADYAKFIKENKLEK